MPEFEKSPGVRKGRGGGGGKKVSASTTLITEPRCLVCQSPNRKVIDQLLARGNAYRELERVFGIDRRSLSNHDQKHLNIQDAAMRRIVQEEAEDIDAALEEGVRGIIKHRIFLETALEKALDGVLSGDVQVEPRDAVAIIDKLEQLDTRTTEAQVTQMKIELAAYIKSMKQVVPSEMWEKILASTRLEVERVTRQLPGGE